MRAKKWKLLPALWLSLVGLAGWAAGQTNISNSPNWTSTCPRITVDPVGNAHVVWAEFYSMNGPYPSSGDAYYAKLNAATQQWSAPLNLSNSGLCFSGEWYVVGIDSDPAGNVYVVYVDGPTIKLRTLAAGAWSVPFVVGLASGEVDSARIAVDAQGNLFVCWFESGPGVIYSRARVGGAWENVATLSHPGVRAKFPEIAVGPNVVYCVWQDGSSGYAYHAVFATRARTAGASWSSFSRITAGYDAEEHPAVKVDAGDVAHIVYTPYFDASGWRIVRYVAGKSTGWSAPLDLGGLGGAHFPSIGLRGGNLYVVWQLGAGVQNNNRIAGAWTGEAVVPGTSACYLPDVTTSVQQDKKYYVWDGGGEIMFGARAQVAAGGKPSIHAIGDFDGDGHDETAIDFGASGVWLANDTGWTQLSSSNPDGLMAMDVQGDGVDEIVGDFGSLGLYIWVNSAWHIISSRNPDAFVSGNVNGTAGDELIVDFGPIGLWMWNGYDWAQLSGANSDSLVCADVDGDGSAEIASGFGALGLWLWNSGSWSQLSGLAPQSMIAGNADRVSGEELFVDFGAVGVWCRNGARWIKLSSADPDALVIADVNGDGIKEFLADFGAAGAGLYLWINNLWVQLSTSDPDRVIAADVDGDGRDEVIGDFGFLGLFVWDGSGWNQISAVDPENIMSGDTDGDGKDEIMGDFGLLGFWGWYAGTWYLLSSLNPD